MKKGSQQKTLLPFLSIDPVTALASLNVELGNNAELSLTFARAASSACLIT